MAPNPSGQMAVDAPPATMRRRISTRCSAFLEWAGNAAGALSFLWATVAMLGGFCTLLQPADFWSTTTIIFIEALRLFAKDNLPGSRSLFGTNEAIEFMVAPFSRWLIQQREVFYTTLVVTGLAERIINYFPIAARSFLVIVLLVVFLLMSFKPSGYALYLQRHLRAVLLVCLLLLYILSGKFIYSSWKHNSFHEILFPIIDVLLQSLAVVLLAFRPSWLIRFTNTTPGRKILGVTKIVTSIGLAGAPLVKVLLPAAGHALVYIHMPKAVATVLFSITSFQIEDGVMGYWIECMMILGLIVSWAFTFGSANITPALVLLVLVVGMVTRNLQIPASVARVLLSTLRLWGQELRDIYPTTQSPNLLPTIKVFYWLVICQGVLYLSACICSLFSKVVGPATFNQDSKDVGNSDVVQPGVGSEDESLLVGSIRIRIPPAEPAQSNNGTPRWMLVGTVPVQLE